MKIKDKKLIEYISDKSIEIIKKIEDDKYRCFFSCGISLRIKGYTKAYKNLTFIRYGDVLFKDLCPNEGFGVSYSIVNKGIEYCSDLIKEYKELLKKELSYIDIS